MEKKIMSGTAAGAVLLVILVIASIVRKPEFPSIHPYLDLTLIDADGTEYDGKDLKEFDYIVLYFSCSTSPACREFTPQLISFCNRLRGKVNFQVLLVSSEKTEEQQMTYMDLFETPFLAIPFENKKAKQKLITDFDAVVIPELIIFDHSGKALIRASETGGLRKSLSDFERLTGPAPGAE